MNKVFLAIGLEPSLTDGVSVCIGERGREQIERERRKEVRRVEKSQSALSQTATRIGLSLLTCLCGSQSVDRLSVCLLPAELEREVGEREERLRELRETLSSLDQEHDVLRRETDKKDETIQQLQQQLTEKVRNSGSKKFGGSFFMILLNV